MYSLRKIAIGLTVVLAVAWQMPSAYAGDGPTSFYWGTDSGGPAPSSSASTCPSSSVPWLEPNVTRSGCGRYGGYFGKVGSFSVFRLNCSLQQLWNSTAANRANANYNAGIGMGAAPYWYAGGPGADPAFNGTTSEAYTWGKNQAREAVTLADQFPVKTNIMFFDVEEPNHSRSSIYTGWNETITNCASLQSASACCSPALARATFNGFWDYIWYNTAYFPAVYSAPGTWNSIFGTSSYGNLSNTMEWTADWSGCVNPPPYGWTQGAGNCASNSANFFGGISSSSNCAVAWQWAGGSADYVQIDTSRLFACR